ncbi:MAG: AbrB/MazE/SpoVT family DNA-binding domain-containing protein [Rhodoglobus sp.]
MSGNYSAAVGNKGRLVLPAALRKERGWNEGAVLVMVPTEYGVLLESRDVLRDSVQSGLAGADLVSDLLAERRAEAAGEDAG